MSIGAVLKPLRYFCRDRKWNMDDFMSHVSEKIDGKQQSVWYVKETGGDLLAAAMEEMATETT